jgi:hypothetical protein
MIYKRSQMAGTFYAECEECDFKSVYWESEEDLEHDCVENTEG